MAFGIGTSCDLSVHGLKRPSRPRYRIQVVIRRKVHARVSKTAAEHFDLPQKLDFKLEAVCAELTPRRHIRLGCRVGHTAVMTRGANLHEAVSTERTLDTLTLTDRYTSTLAGFRRIRWPCDRIRMLSTNSETNDRTAPATCHHIRAWA